MIILYHDGLARNRKAESWDWEFGAGMALSARRRAADGDDLAREIEALGFGEAEVSPPAVEMRRACSHEDMSAIQALRYSCYIKEGAIAPSETQSMGDRYDEDAHAINFSLHADGEIVAAIRIHVVDAAHPTSPSTDTFPEHVQSYLTRRQTLIDPSRFVVDKVASSRVSRLAYLALRLPFLAADHFGAQIALAAVRTEHMPFYARVLRYTKVAEPRTYPCLIKPLGLMLADVPSERETVLRNYPIFASRPGEVAALFSREGGANPDADEVTARQQRTRWNQ